MQLLEREKFEWKFTHEPTLSVLIFACIYFRELKKIVFREYLFSRMTSF